MQASDGTIYAIESHVTDQINSDGSHQVDTQLVLLDGSDGSVRARVPLPREVVAFQAQLHGYLTCASTRSEYRAPTLGPVISNDGSAYVLLRQYTRTKFGLCHESSDAREIDRGVELWRISPAGVVTIADVFAQHCSLGIGVSNCDTAPALKHLVPDTAGGAYAIWLNLPLGGSAETRLTRMTSAGVIALDQVVPTNTSIEIVGDEGTLYSGGSAIDDSTWANKWQYLGYPLMALHNGGVVTHDGTSLRWYGGNGDLLKSAPLEADSTSSFVKQGEWLSVDQDLSLVGKPIRSVVGPIPNQTRFSFGQITSRPLGIYSSCALPPLWGPTKGLAPNQDYTFIFDRLQPGSLWPSDDEDTIIQSVLASFDLWEAANIEPGPPTPNGITFTKVDSGSAFIKLQHGEDLGIDPDTGRPIAGRARGPISPATGFLTSVDIIWDDSEPTMPSYYKKIGLHELGHVHGLFHMDGIGPSSVMNNASGPNDSRGHVSEVVTVCDRDRARESALRTWP